MSESADRDIDQILAFLEGRATDAEQARVLERLKTDRAFARQLAVQARISSSLESLARVEAHAPEAEAQAEALKIQRPAARAKSAHVAAQAGTRATALRDARAARQRRSFWAVAALLLVTLAVGGYFLAHRSPVGGGEISAPPPSATSTVIGQIAFVPPNIPVQDLPVLIQGQGEKAVSRTVATGMSVCAGDRLVTLGHPAQASADSGVAPVLQVSIRHQGGVTMDLAEDTELDFPASSSKTPADLSLPIALTRGRVYIEATAPATADRADRAASADSHLHLTTAAGQFTADDASFELFTTAQLTIARVRSGYLKVSNALGSQQVAQMEECLVEVAKAPNLPVAVFANAIWGGRAGVLPAPSPNAALAGDITLERPTLTCLGATWVIKGDQNHNAQVTCRYRPAEPANQPWRTSLPFWPIDAAGWPAGYQPVPSDQKLFAGSLFDLAPNTRYELDFVLADPDGQNTHRTLTAATRAVPAPMVGGPQFHVVPATAAEVAPGTGTAQDPFRGLTVAETHAVPGATFLLHAGTYAGAWVLQHSGEPAKPITWQGGLDGPVVLDGALPGGKRLERIVTVTSLHDILFDRLSLQNADFLLVAHMSQRIAVTRCLFSGCDTAVAAAKQDATHPLEDFYIADNTFHGPETWPAAVKGREDSHATYVGGQGHVFCHNRVTGFGDGIDTAPTPETGSLDIYENDISEITDDAIELDYSFRNARCFRNRITNVFQGISVQPIQGGPAYVFRNTLYNVELETIKLHSSPNGVLIFHNTGVKTGPAIELNTAAPVYHCFSRNNLWVGTTGEYGLFFDTTMLHCDFDYDGCAGTFDKFMLWNRSVTATLDSLRDASAEHHAVRVDSAHCFIADVQAPTGEIHPVTVGAQDLRLSPQSGAIDKGAVLQGVNDDYQGQAPDLGAFEIGAELPHYGPRP